MIEWKDIITFATFVFGIIAVLVKNENRISTIENKLSNTLDSISKQIIELKQEKQDKNLMQLELANLKMEIKHLENNLKTQLMYVSENVDEIKELLHDRKL